MRQLFALLLLYFTAFFTIPTAAQVVPVGFPVTQVGNQIFFGPTAVTSANVGDFTFAPAPTGTGVATSATRRLPTGNGTVIDVVAKTVIPRASVAQAIVKAAVKINPYVQVGQLGYELWKLLRDNGVEGTPDATKPDGIQWQEKMFTGCPNNIGLSLGGYAPACTKEQACANRGGTWYPQSQYPESCSGPGIEYGTNFVQVTMTPVNSYEPRTRQQIDDLLSTGKAIEDSANLIPAIKEATATGESIPAPQPTSVTGPATGPSGAPTTTVNPDGSKTVSTPSSSITYGPNSVTINNVTTVTNVSTAGATTSTTTTTAPQTTPVEDKDDETPPVDTPFGPIPTLYTPVYPNGFDGIFEAKKAAMLASPLGSLGAQLMPTGMVSGSCPSWPIDLTFGAWAAFGVHDVAPPCWIWDFGKVVIILSAMLLARALIFGG